MSNNCKHPPKRLWSHFGKDIVDKTGNFLSPEDIDKAVALIPTMWIGCFECGQLLGRRRMRESKRYREVKDA